ncbi:GNAT family N-acetyltransferase [Paenibacillus aestuarii]|uniref:GNAT family N-acetyltransferase n=1 Tax=Paenibacillus aestuarii TaxID=516965 RepID=A0ABW0KAS7_9BACL|nr:GNAT family N-acetyltransferase [Paenibacillus aestuarii]
MKQGLYPVAGMSAQELEAVRELWRVCNEAEQIDIKLNWSTLSTRSPGITNDFLYYENDRVVGFLGIYSFLSTEVEISGMVHPDARRKGIFSQLVQTAIAECKRRTIPKAIFINERGSASGKAFLSQLGARYSFSEYVMELQDADGANSTVPLGEDVTLRAAAKEDVDLLVKLNTSGFAMPEENAREYVMQTLEGDKERTWIAETGDEHVAIGKIGALVEGDGRAFIYGFCVLPEYRSKGLGRQILRHTIELLKSREQAKTVKLEVAVENEKALGLYESCGFQMLNANDYYEFLLV